MLAKKTWAHLALLGVALIYGTNYTIAKGVMNSGIISPLGFIFFRVLFALLSFQIIHRLFIKEKVARVDLFRLFLCGMFGVAINQIFFFKGLEFTTPIHASLIMITTPFVVLLASTFLLKEKITATKFLGIILGAIGAVLLILKGQDKLLSNENGTLGDLFILINATSYGLYLVVVKPLLAKYQAITIVNWIFTFGALLVLPICFSEAKAIEWSAFDLWAWIGFGYVLLFTTVFAYLLNAFALTKLNPATVGAYIYLQPLIAGSIALIAGFDTLSITMVLATMLIFSGLYLVSKKSLRKT